MRVNISYSVELEDVLKELQMLYMRENNKILEVSSEAHQVLKEKYTDKNLSHITHALAEYREALAQFDIKLGEIANILSGYSEIKTSPDVSPQVPQTEEIEEENE